MKLFLHVKSHAYGPVIIIPGFTHAREFANNCVGHPRHTGAEVAPQLFISRYCAALHCVASYVQGMHSPLEDEYHPAVPFHGMHCVLQIEFTQLAVSNDCFLHGVSTPVNCRPGEPSGWHAV